MLPKQKELTRLEQANKRVFKRIQLAGGNDIAPVALLEEALLINRNLRDLLEQIYDEEVQARHYVSNNPFFLRRLINMSDELWVMLNASSPDQVLACQLLRELRIISQAPDVDTVAGSRVTTELGQLIFRMASKTKGASAEPFESLAKIWKRLNEHPFALFEPLAGNARERHLAVFELVRQARLPEKEDPNDPLAKVWASQEEFINWLRQRGVKVSKAWLSGLLKGEGEKAWNTIDDVKRWMAKKLGIHNPPTPLLWEYYDKHNNALPSLSSLIGNAKGKKPKRGKP